VVLVDVDFLAGLVVAHSAAVVVRMAAGVYSPEAALSRLLHFHPGVLVAADPDEAVAAAFSVGIGS
jgi:hypothetical protein